MASYSRRMGLLLVSRLNVFFVVSYSVTPRAGEGRVTIFASQSISGTFNYVVREVSSANQRKRLINDNTGWRYRWGCLLFHSWLSASTDNFLVKKPTFRREWVSQNSQKYPTCSSYLQVITSRTQETPPYISWRYSTPVRNEMAMIRLCDFIPFPCR